MVPGSTFREGWHFWRVTLSRRLSSRQAMGGAATPFPREETTPPVTNTYLGAVRKSLEILRARLGTNHYAEKLFACQTTIHSTENISFLSRAPGIECSLYDSTRSRRIFCTFSMSAGTSTLTGSYSVSTTRM